MSIQIDLVDETMRLSNDDLATIEKLMFFTAEKEGIEGDSELSVTFVSNDAIQEINREYRGKDMPTDVISFAMEELGEGEIPLNAEDMPRILGDIVISIAKAEEQAVEYGHSFIRELGFLAVHGFLHLLGYDHMNEKDENEMFSKQKEILDEFGLQRK